MSESERGGRREQMSTVELTFGRWEVWKTTGVILVVLSVAATTCVKPINFDRLAGADRIDVRTPDDKLPLRAERPVRPPHNLAFARQDRAATTPIIRSSQDH